ncbi:MAG: winged helix-turn-helix transcriptional regulator [Proteobacteria bacterium]|nr:winged helix-turn-helix transcriptional regulator [Pseudomonadota bacterium]
MRLYHEIGREILDRQDRQGWGAKVIDRISDAARRVLGEKVGEKVGESLTPNQKRILSLLRQNTRLSARELAEEVGISSRKIEQNIARLKESGSLRRIGSAKGGYWEVLK